MFDYDLEKPQYSPLMQLAILLMLTGVGFFVGGLVSLGIVAVYLHVPLEKLPDVLRNTTDANSLRLLQSISAFFTMALPSFIFARLLNRNPFGYIGFNNAISGKQVFIIVGIVFTGLILSGALGQANERIPLPKAAQEYFNDLENKYNNLILVIANMKSVKDYIISLVVIALLPAIFEEMLFRGALQPVMINLIRNPFLGILITSILFSAIHASYYGFLPRLALGLIIGYVFYFSRNLWLSSITHFLYNAVGITQVYALSKHGPLTQDAMKDNLFPLYFGLLAAGTLYVIFIFFRKECEVVLSIFIQRKKSNTEEFFK
jgi:membrane protease YdiL (CAAX protease family)